LQRFWQYLRKLLSGFKAFEESSGWIEIERQVVNYVHDVDIGLNLLEIFKKITDSSSLSCNLLFFQNLFLAVLLCKIIMLTINNLPLLLLLDQPTNVLVKINVRHSG
jgi:hypothetical protein